VTKRHKTNFLLEEEDDFLRGRLSMLPFPPTDIKLNISRGAHAATSPPELAVYVISFPLSLRAAEVSPSILHPRFHYSSLDSGARGFALSARPLAPILVVCVVVVVAAVAVDGGKSLAFVRGRRGKGHTRARASSSLCS